MYVSLPHFLHADPEIADSAKDLNPNEEEEQNNNNNGNNGNNNNNNSRDQPPPGFA